MSDPRDRKTRYPFWHRASYALHSRARRLVAWSHPRAARRDGRRVGCLRMRGRRDLPFWRHHPKPPRDTAAFCSHMVVVAASRVAQPLARRSLVWRRWGLLLVKVSLHIMSALRLCFTDTLDTVLTKSITIDPPIIPRAVPRYAYSMCTYIHIYS